MAATKKVNPVVAELQKKFDGLTVRKVKGVLKVVSAKKAVVVRQEKKMEIHKEYDISYEEYLEQELLCVTATWLDESDLKDLKEQYPEYAARAKAEADARRGCTWEEYQTELQAIRDARAKETTIFVLEGPHKVGDIVRDGDYQYRVVEASSYMSEKEASELEDIAPGINSGWYTKVELVA